jgi:hypothetical protein
LDAAVSASSRIPQPARQILSYFVRNPSAADSLEGIARWRLLEEAIHRNIAETEESLRWLVKEGYLVEMTQMHSTRLFRLNPAKRDEAESALSSGSQTDPNNTE